MAVSANSVIHYLRSIENLKGILTQGFTVKYCLESILIHENELLSYAFPMVCFCDIPLSEIDKHTASYGSYGIGLSKKWAKRKKLNPILYIEKNSKISDSLYKQTQHITGTNDKTSFEWFNQFFELLSYCKNYEGHLELRGETIKYYKFYDEREWRFIPSVEELNNNPTYLDGKKYLQSKDLYNSNINRLSLDFSIDDISYLLVKEENEIVELISALGNIYADKSTIKQLAILFSKITSIQNIKNDY